MKNMNNLLNLIKEFERDKNFENSKIRIALSCWSSGNGISACMKDENKKLYPVLSLNVLGERNINITNTKIFNFVFDKVTEWKIDEESERNKRLNKIKEKEKELKNLINDF